MAVAIPQGEGDAAGSGSHVDVAVAVEIRQGERAASLCDAVGPGVRRSVNEGAVPHAQKDLDAAGGEYEVELLIAVEVLGLNIVHGQVFRDERGGKGPVAIAAQDGEIVAGEMV